MCRSRRERGFVHSAVSLDFTAYDGGASTDELGQIDVYITAWHLIFYASGFHYLQIEIYYLGRSLVGQLAYDTPVLTSLGTVTLLPSCRHLVCSCYSSWFMVRTDFLLVPKNRRVSCYMVLLYSEHHTYQPHSPGSSLS